MNSTPSPVEQLICNSADQEGRIPFPEGNASEVNVILKVLMLMESRGYVRRVTGKGLFHPYELTASGQSCRDAAAKITGSAFARKNPVIPTNSHTQMEEMGSEQ